MSISITASTVNINGQLSGHFQLTGNVNVIVNVNNSQNIQVTDVDPSTADLFQGSVINASTFDLGGGNDTATFGTIGNSVVLGSDGDDILNGSQSLNTTFNGGNGNDFLAAKMIDNVTRQANFLTGGAGADIYELPVYNRTNPNLSRGVNVVTDFRDGQDLISMPRQIYEAQGFANGASYFNARVRVTDTTGNLPDGSPIRGATFTIGNESIGAGAIMTLKNISASAITAADVVGRFSPF
jgi:hypothetical protein